MVVAEGIGQEPIWRHLNRQVFLGNDCFVQQMHQKAKVLSEGLNIPKAQRRPPAPPLRKLAEAQKTNGVRLDCYDKLSYTFTIKQTKKITHGATSTI